MVPNINQFTEQLRMMPDQALQRIAMMYKQDPYILPMVIAEDAARKKLRAAAQAQMAQPQPKVVDQALMGMGQQPQAAPGLAALQAPNMERMADGGIAGYADPESIEPVIRMAGGGVARYAEQGLVDLDAIVPPAMDLGPMYSEKMGPSTDPLAEERRIQYANELALKEAEKTLQSYGLKKRSADPEGFQRAREARDAAAKEVAKARRLPAVDEGERRFRDPKAITSEELAIYKNIPERAVPKPPMMPIPDVQFEGKQAPGERRAPRTAADVVRQPAPVSAAPASAVQMPPSYTAPTPEATAEGIAALSKAPNEETAKAYAELRKMYEPEERELAQRRGQRGGEALLRAGLAMLGGTSPHAAVNIGRGATEGLNAYQAAQAADDQAARALRQAQITMRMAERQEQIGNRRDAVTLFSQAQQQQQAAASSAQQAEQLKNTRDYQQGSLAVMQQNAATNAKLVQARIKALDAPRQQQERMMAEYGKIQKQVMADLSKDVTYMTETDTAKKEQIFRSRMNMAIANNPFLANTLFSSTPTGKVRDLLGKDDEED